MLGCIRCCDRGEVDIIGPSEGLVASSILAGRTTLLSGTLGTLTTGQASDGFCQLKPYLEGDRRRCLARVFGQAEPEGTTDAAGWARSSPCPLQARHGEGPAR